LTRSDGRSKIVATERRRLERKMEKSCGNCQIKKTIVVDEERTDFCPIFWSQIRNGDVLHGRGSQCPHWQHIFNQTNNCSQCSHRVVVGQVDRGSTVDPIYACDKNNPLFLPDPKALGKQTESIGHTVDKKICQEWERRITSLFFCGGFSS